ncbi:hypothetical protein IL306_005477 [Fusarium sp. DS 682]|nr:hypothetical protein IL306_005477 [Fusarium sp. DS 682]
MRILTGRFAIWTKDWGNSIITILFDSKCRIYERECPQQKDGFNCGIFTLAVLQALLNRKSIPSEVDADYLRSFFAGQLEGTAGSEPAKPSSEAMSPGVPSLDRPASIEQGHSIAHNLGLPADPGEHDVALPLLSHLQEFRMGLEKEEANLREKRNTLEKQEEHLANMSQERDSFQQELENDKRLAHHLAGEVEKSEVDYQETCEWLDQFITGHKVESENKLLNKIISDTESTIQSAAAEMNSLKEKLESAQTKCNEGHEGIQKLEAKILSSTEQRDAMKNNLEKTRESLAQVKQMYAQIAPSLGLTVHM